MQKGQFQTIFLYVRKEVSTLVFEIYLLLLVYKNVGHFPTALLVPGIELAILARGPWNEFSNLVCFSFPIILINTPVFQFFPPQKRD